MDDQQVAKIIDPEVWEPLEDGDDGAWQSVAGFPDRRADAFAAAERIRAAGYALVKLPAMEVNEDGQTTWPLPQVDKYADVFIRQSDGQISFTSVKNPIETPEHALAVAAALIAAAKHMQGMGGSAA